MCAQTLDPFQIQYFTVLRALHFRIEWGVLGMCTVGQFRLPRLPWWCEESLSYVEHSPGTPLCLFSELPRLWSQTGPWNVCAHMGNSGIDLLQALRLALHSFLLVLNRGWVLGMMVWLGKGVQALLRLDPPWLHARGVYFSLVGRTEANSQWSPSWSHCKSSR